MKAANGDANSEVSPPDASQLKGRSGSASPRKRRENKESDEKCGSL